MKVGAYRIEAACPELLQWLDKAHGQDKLAEGKASRFGCLAGVFLVVGIFGFPVIFGAVLEREGVAMVGGLVCVAVAVVLGVVAWLNKRHDLDDRKVDLLRRLLGTLRVDVPPDRPVSLLVDFGTYCRKPFLTDSQGGFLGLGVRQKAYSHPWLDLTVRLADRSLLRVQATRNVKRREKPKRKYTKVKERMRDEVVFRLKVPGADGPALADLAARLQSRPLPGALAVARCQARGSEVQVRLRSGAANRSSGRTTYESGMENLADGDAILAALVWLFRECRVRPGAGAAPA